MKILNFKLWIKLLITTAIYLTYISAAYAGTGGSGGLPWESPLQKIVDSITGPVALAISILAMAAAGGMLVWGGELGEFTKKIIMLVLAISFLVFGASFMTTVFGISGALI